MMFLAAALLAVGAVSMRSVCSVVSIALLMVAVFVTVKFLSSGSAFWLDLLVAIVGYNAGLMSVIGGMLAVGRFHATFRSHSFRPRRVSQMTQDQIFPKIWRL